MANSPQEGEVRDGLQLNCALSSASVRGLFGLRRRKMITELLERTRDTLAPDFRAVAVRKARELFDAGVGEEETIQQAIFVATQAQAASELSGQ